jgi:hypothetical protein
LACDPEIIPQRVINDPNAPLARIWYTVFKNESIARDIISEGQGNYFRGKYSTLYPEEDLKVLQDSLAKVPEEMGRIIHEANMSAAFLTKCETPTCTSAAPLMTTPFTFYS